ncbi:MAG: hydrogenase iron-sulfur subunit, partial [Dehalococcoidia bacterium]|nr:hydrogenase iron-sulfur subunit [Dehalococcoidia bacterium]
MKHYEPKLVCFSCKFGWGYLADEEDLRDRVKNWVPIICSGKIDTTHILDAFKRGADGVLILGCPEG